MGTKAKWPAPPPLLASQSERWGGGYPVETPWIFPGPQNVIWYCLIRSEKNKLGLWICFLFKKGWFWPAKAKWPAPPPLLAFQLERWGGGYPVETPPIFLSPQMSYDIAWLGQKKIEVMVLLFIQGRTILMILPEKPSNPPIFDLKLHSPSHEFFHSPLDI